MKKPSTLWKVITAFIAVFAGSIFIDSWILEPGRVEHVCNKIHIGTSTSDVFTRAEEYNLRLIESRPVGKDLKYITLHGGSFSRYICEITHDGNQVVKNEFKKMRDRFRP